MSGWVVIQNRFDGSTSFHDKLWNEYKTGFGDRGRDYYLGNDNIHELTKSGDMKLRVELEAHDGRTAWAEYDTFR